MFFRIEDQKSKLKIEKSKTGITLKNADFEILSPFFSVVPDEKLLESNLFPVYNVRFKTKGLIELMKIFKAQYGLRIAVKGIVLNKEKYNISSYDVQDLFNNETYDDFFDDFHFNDLRPGESKGVLINFVNKNKNLAHTSPFVLKKTKNNENCIVILDSSFYFLGKLDDGAISVSFAKKFIKKDQTVKIYCHDFKFVRDQNSCSSLAVSLIKDILLDSSLLDGILENALIYKRDELEFSLTSQFHMFEIPSKLFYLSQSFSDLESRLDVGNRRPITKMMLFRKISDGYSPENEKELNEDYFKKKEVNLTLHTLSHYFAHQIMSKLSLERFDYNPAYWIDLHTANYVSEESANSSFLRLIVKMKRNLKNIDNRRISRIEDTDRLHVFN